MADIRTATLAIYLKAMLLLRNCRPARTACVVLALCALAWAGGPDPHLASPRLSPLVRASVFAHGYLHGYEEGFHVADTDLQLERAPRNPQKMKEARQAAGYRPEFGSKRSFEAGYRDGFRVGYADGIAGRTFRALSAVENLAGPPLNSAAQPSLPFDEGFARGYSSGQQQGLADARRDAPFAPPPAVCPLTWGEAQEQQQFCSAYAGGYGVGYGDGFVNVSSQPTTEASVREK